MFNTIVSAILKAILKKKYLIEGFLMTALLLLPACGNKCDFIEQCDGTTLQVCGAGPDQLFNREVHSYACPASHSICKQDGQRAWCVVKDSDTCDVNKKTQNCKGSYDFLFVEKLLKENPNN